MENQTNNNEIIQETEMMEKVETVEVAEMTEQPEVTKFDESFGTAPDDQVTSVNQKKKKTMMIGLIIGAIVLLFGGVGAGVHAFMNSPEMKMTNLMTKIQKAKKLDGTMKLQGLTTIPTVLTAETIEMKVDGTYSASRSAEQGSYFKIDAQAEVTGPKQLQKTIDEMHINGKYHATLTKDMILNWDGLGQKGSSPLTEDQKQAVKKFVEADGTTLSDEQKAIQELYTFLIKGYTPIVENEGNKTVVKITKSELEKIIHTGEKNIASDSGKFEELYKKVNKSATAKEIKTIVASAKNGNITKQTQQLLNAIETLQMRVTYEDLGNQVKQTTNMDMTLKQAQGGVTLSAKFNFQFDTTYSL